MSLLFVVFLIASFFIPIVCATMKEKKPVRVCVEDADLVAAEKVDHYFFENVKDIMQAEGFEVVADLLIYNESFEVYERWFYNSAEGIRLQVREHFHKRFDKERHRRGEKVLVEAKTNTIILETVFADGLKLITSTSKLPSIFKYINRIHHKYGNAEPQELLKRHREHIVENSLGKQVIKNNWGDAKEKVLEEYNEDIEGQIKQGIIKLDSSRQYYHMTIYGAVVTVVKVLLYKIFNKK